MFKLRNILSVVALAMVAITMAVRPIAAADDANAAADKEGQLIAVLESAAPRPTRRLRANCWPFTARRTLCLPWPSC